MAKTKQLFARRVRRTRDKVKRRLGDRLRLSVFRSSKHIYAQVIDDRRGVTLVAASTLERRSRAGSAPAPT